MKKSLKQFTDQMEKATKVAESWIEYSLMGNT